MHCFLDSFLLMASGVGYFSQTSQWYEDQRLTPLPTPLQTLQIPHIRLLPEIEIMLACGNTLEQFFCRGL